MTKELFCVCPVCRRTHFETVVNNSELVHLEPVFWYEGNIPAHRRECENRRKDSVYLEKERNGG